MGIRFSCPHCNRALNVKAAQAGLDGLCPYCRRLIKIEAEPQFDSAAQRVAKFWMANEMDEDDNQVTQVGLDPVSQQHSDSLLMDLDFPETSSIASGNRRFRTVPEVESKDNFVLDKPASPSYLGKRCPISEAPKLIWYYRIKEQAERGPLKAKTMQAELDAGRVSPGCLVWREDWDEWRPAEQVFPKLLLSNPGDKTVLSRLKATNELAGFFQFVSDHRILFSIATMIVVLLLALLIGTLYRFTK